MEQNCKKKKDVCCGICEINERGFLMCRLERWAGIGWKKKSEEVKVEREESFKVGNWKGKIRERGTRRLEKKYRSLYMQKYNIFFSGDKKKCGWKVDSDVDKTGCRLRQVLLLIL